MNITCLNRRQNQGTILLTVMIIGGVLFLVTASILSLSSNSVKSSHGRVDWNKAYYSSENALIWAAQNVVDSQPAAGSSNYYSTANGNLPTAYLVAPTNGDATFKNAWVSIVQPTTMENNSYVITSSALVNNKVRTLRATITAFPVSQVFDFEYFLNNWGWWWGTPIYGQGGQRSNWDFDLRDHPTVNGYIYAANNIDENGVPYHVGTAAPFVGLAAADPLTYVHDGAPRVPMPNLMDFSNYTATALLNPATNGIWIGSTQVVAGVHNSGNTSGTSGIYLVGTSADPVKIQGTVVVPGDVVIKGVITGRGTLYVGGHLYVANNLTYANGPDFSALPETMSPTNRDAWVQSNANKDLVAFAVNGAIYGGDVTDGDWIGYCYNYPGSGLSQVGDESHLGADGILGTGDDYTPFLHPDGTMSSAYDADGNGVVNHNYDYETDINMNGSRASKIAGYPTSNGNPVPYNQVATCNMGTLSGIFYTDHAYAMRLWQQSVFYGAVISRNEQIVFNGTCNFIYDSRIHSRYHSDPNQYVNLGLPYGKTLSVNSLVELAPNSTGLYP